MQYAKCEINKKVVKGNILFNLTDWNGNEIAVLPVLKLIKACALKHYDKWFNWKNPNIKSEDEECFLVEYKGYSIKKVYKSENGKSIFHGFSAYDRENIKIGVFFDLMSVDYAVILDLKKKVDSGKIPFEHVELKPFLANICEEKE